MQHFPIYVALNNRRVALSGGGDAALAKLRLLLKTNADLSVFTTNPAAEIEAWAHSGLLTLNRRSINAAELTTTTLFYAADENATKDAETAALARDAGAMVNIVDNLEDSDFLTPAIVDRSPVTIAIGTEGTAPVLARAIKAQIEAQLPSSTGPLARIAKSFRTLAAKLPAGRARRDFWSEFYATRGPKAIATGETAVRPALNDLLAEHMANTAAPGHVAFVGAGPGDPDLLTMKARRALDTADVVIHDRLITSKILDLARREATIIDAGKQGFGPSMSQDDINTLIVKHAANGAQVVRLKSGDATVFGRLDEEIDACDAAGLSWNIVPGITAASASVAALGQSLTKRGRNSSVRFLTGHDMRGFADHDWSALARPGEVAAIYMGKKSARFVQGRLLMHGASRDTPVSVIENASRPDQRILDSTLATLPADLSAAGFDGPALMLFGLAPRAAHAQSTYQMETA